MSAGLKPVKIWGILNSFAKKKIELLGLSLLKPFYMFYYIQRHKMKPYYIHPFPTGLGPKPSHS